jgi:hypothetical protein
MFRKIEEIYTLITQKQSTDEPFLRPEHHQTASSELYKSNRKLSQIKHELRNLHRPNSNELPLFPCEKPR